MSRVKSNLPFLERKGTCSEYEAICSCVDHSNGQNAEGDWWQGGQSWKGLVASLGLMATSRGRGVKAAHAAETASTRTRAQTT